MAPVDESLIDFQKHRDFTINPTHIIDRLYGSIPQAVIAENRERRKAEILRIREYAKTIPEDYREVYLILAIQQVRAKYEGFIENSLHKNTNGPYYLQNPKIAQLVIKAWLYQAKHKQIIVIAICVMSNHVHALVRGPDNGLIIEAGPILNSVKSFTARQANKLLNRPGNPFWDKYFDRDVREGKFMTVLWYVVNNPVKAGLVKSWKDWPHTYVNPEYKRLLTG